MHVPNGYETMLEQHPSVHIYKQPFTQLWQPFTQLWTLPPELSNVVSLSKLPLLGESPDGFMEADPTADRASGSVLS